MSMQTNLPGFPGASHIYHVGATGFYLEYADKLGLSTQQRTSLNDVKQRTLVDQSNRQRKIDEAEQALWLLTAAEQPDAASVEAKIREIEKLKADQRLEFIRSVGEAAKILTDDQRRMVLGMVPMPGSTVPSASAPKPMNMGK
jgi:Spy/CpxP family protein refolding chaperone